MQLKRELRAGITIFALHSKKNSMGKGDKKTKKGKIFMASFGKSRPANPQKLKKLAAAAAAKTEEKPA